MLWEITQNVIKNVHVKKKKSNSQLPWLEWCPRAGSSSAMLFGLSLVFSFQDHIPHLVSASRTLSLTHTHHINTQTHTALTHISCCGTGYPQSFFSLLQSSSSPCAEHLPSLLFSLQRDTNSPKQGLFTGSAFLAIWTLQHSFFLQAYLTKSNKNTSGKYLLFRLFCILRCYFITAHFTYTRL